MPTIESRARNGAYAGVVLAILGSFTAASIIWGLLRPRYQATIIDDQGGLELNMVDNVEFTGFFWFVFTTGILAIILSARIHQKTLAYRGLSMLLWVTLWSLVGSILFAKLGDLTTITVYHIPHERRHFRVCGLPLSGRRLLLDPGILRPLSTGGPRPRLAGAGLR